MLLLATNCERGDCMHVTLGAIMLTIIWLRVMKGHFTPTSRFAFEAVAWYWHFVDVVWVGLYVYCQQDQ